MNIYWTRKICPRVAIASVLIGGMLVYYHWEAELTSHLAFRITNLPFNNLEDLSQSSQFNLIVAKGTVHLDFFKNSDDPVRSKIWRDKLKPHFDDLPFLEEMEYMILNDPYLVAYSDSAMKMNPAFISCKIIEIKPPIRNTHLAFAIQKYSPLYQTFNI